VVVLASNLHRNLDEAFLRRFEAVVYFPPPRAEERLRLWREGFSPRAQVTADLERIAREHDLTGGAIINVIGKVSLAAIARGGLSSGDGVSGDGGSRASPISHGDIEEAIRSERGKNG
jgi:SpoVK/Ycf46/Vps4 family AAA+-type ATPase